MKTAQPMVSIIVPVYNAEKYLKECIDSILAQTYPDFELICVDDGSADSSLSILNKYQEQDNRVQVYTQKNQCAGIARNNGLFHANGKYVLFLDSDDFFEETLLEKTVETAEKNEADVVLFSANYFNNAKQMFEDAPWELRLDLLPKAKVFNSLDIQNNIFQITGSAPWNKLFRKKLITDNGIIFPNLKNSEDLSFICCALAMAKRISFHEDVLVHIRRAHGSNLEANKDDNPIEFYKGLKFLKQYLYKNNVYENYKESFIELALQTYVYQVDTLNKSEKKQELTDFFFDKGLSLLDESSQTYRKIMIDWIERIEKERHWLKEQLENYKTRVEELENYIEELLQAKSWLENQSNEHEKYISELLTAKQWLEMQNDKNNEIISEKDLIIKKMKIVLLRLKMKTQS